MSMQFAISTATIVSGAVAERVKFIAYAFCESALLSDMLNWIASLGSIGCHIYASM